MKTAFQYINTATINFFREKIGRMTDYREANELLIQLSGIDSFFRNKNEFLTFLDLLKPCSVVCEGIARREYGDFHIWERVLYNIRFKAFSSNKTSLRSRNL